VRLGLACCVRHVFTWVGAIRLRESQCECVQTVHSKQRFYIIRHKILDQDVAVDAVEGNVMLQINSHEVCKESGDEERRCEFQF